MDNTEQFGGDKKLPMKSLLAKHERTLIDKYIPKFPKWLEGYDLTLMTILWSMGVIIFGWHAKVNHLWLLPSSVTIALQWFTDSFDGALGRYRDTGIPKWGFYMDHFLDYVFMCSILIGYSFMLDGRDKSLIYMLIPVFGCFMVSSYLAFAATNEFKITFLWAGPTEIRIYFILINFLIILFGTGWIKTLLVYIFAASVIIMCIVVYRTQKYIWNIDMTEKRARGSQQ
jgi:phosphatidylglycerophosphate synthase